MRSKSNLLFSVSVFVFAFHAVVSAQDENENSIPKASIDDLSWITGHWEGDAMGGKFEETWNPPRAGSMMGMFKFVKDTK